MELTPGDTVHVNFDGTYFDASFYGFNEDGLAIVKDMFGTRYDLPMSSLIVPRQSTNFKASHS